MYSRLLKLPLEQSSSIFLFGPRGTGKTHWARAALPDALYIDLLEFELFKSLSANPGRLAEHIPKSYAGWIIIDEVQKIPELLNEVHRLIERYGYRFLLTGSSARSLKRKGVNLLAGRALRYDMHPLVIQELNHDFNLSRALQFGMLPAAVSKENPKKYLTTYVQTYIKEEVFQEGLTRNLAGFTRFLEIASFSQGSVTNLSEIAREVGIDRQVVASYFAILEDLLLAYRLLPFTKRAKRRLAVHPKFYFFDVGVYRLLRPMGPLDKPEEADGAGLETLFLQHLKAINDYNESGYTFYFWRTSNQLEVDFVAYGEKGLIAFEIKRSSTITSKSLTGLKAFQKDYPQANLYLIYTGSHREYHGDIECIPIEQALQQLPNLLKAL
jgi:predicted AAA+ superfamily ATPase